MWWWFITVIWFTSRYIIGLGWVVVWCTVHRLCTSVCHRPFISATYTILPSCASTRETKKNLNHGQDDHWLGGGIYRDFDGSVRIYAVQEDREGRSSGPAAKGSSEHRDGGDHKPVAKHRVWAQLGAICRLSLPDTIPWE